MWRISLLTDNPNSWIGPFAIALQERISQDHLATRCFSDEDIPRGDMCFFLSCEKIVPPRILKRNTHNLVVHPSHLPQGKGFSPLAWQILEGKNAIPITLFEAVEKVDSGCVYYRDVIRLKGHELNSEIKELQGRKTIEMVMRFIDDYPSIGGLPQQGVESFYKRRRKKDLELDIHKPIIGQFDLLRIADNERYPVFFHHRGHEYTLKVYREER